MDKEKERVRGKGILTSMTLAGAATVLRGTFTVP